MIFYNIERDEKLKDVKYAEGTDWEEIICPKEEDHQRPGSRMGNMRINIKVKRVADFLWTFLSECIISNEVAAALKEDDITGYLLKRVTTLNTEVPNSLWEFQAIGQGGYAQKDSGINLKQRCDYCGFEIYSAFKNGIIVDETNWDGSDIFTVNGYPRYILVTEKVKDVIEKQKFSGLIFIPSHELKWPNIPEP